MYPGADPEFFPGVEGYFTLLGVGVETCIFPVDLPCQFKRVEFFGLSPSFKTFFNVATV